MTLRVELVVPEGEVWSGPAELVIAKTLDGDIGVLTGHTPVLGILVEGSVVTIRPEGGPAENGQGEGAAAHRDLTAAVGGGFFSVTDDRVSILAHRAQLGGEVDAAGARAALDKALQDAQASPDEDSDSEPADVQYFRALLRAAGEPDDRS